jgi:hypothetical protein
MSFTLQPHDLGGPSYDAARHLVDFLDDLSKRTGYRPHGVKIHEWHEGKETSGHKVSLPMPAKGFSEFQLDCIQGYAEGLAYWRRVISELDQLEKSVEVKFRLDLTPQEVQSLKLRERIRRVFMPRDLKLTRLLGRILTEKGFKVREPTRVVLITRDKTYRGFALQVRYPFSRGSDEAGVNTTYDRLLPMIADAFAREHRMRSEVVRNGDITTVFFTRDRTYVSSLFESVPQFRIALPQRKSVLSKDVAFFARRSYRACRKLRARYTRDFMMPKRPNPLWDESGYCLVMLYKRGASGQVVDSSYGHSVTKMAQQLAQEYRLKASIEVRPEIRSIVANFSDR